MYMIDIDNTFMYSRQPFDRFYSLLIEIADFILSIVKVKVVELYCLLYDIVHLRLG